MATQPDMIVQFAHFVKSLGMELEMANPKVFADSWVTINGKPSQRFMDPSVDLGQIKTNDAWKYVLPLDQPPSKLNTAATSPKTVLNR